MECTKLNCPMQAGTVTENCGENCPWRTTAETGGLISRTAAIEYLMTNMGWKDEDGYTVDDADEKCAIITDLVNGIPAVDAVPIADAKAIADIALHAISKMEDFGCAYVWEKSGDPYADENNIRGECQYYRRKIKDIKGRWRCDNGTD